jgi:predicted CopG family antitoxin
MEDVKDKPMPTKTIVIKAETYHALGALKIIPREPFDSVIKRLLDQSKDLIKG